VVLVVDLALKNAQMRMPQEVMLMHLAEVFLEMGCEDCSERHGHSSLGRINHWDAEFSF
jgi:hypothetical protein